MLTHYLWIGLGGSLGAIFRVFLSKFIPPSALGMPLQILLINVFGCLMMGLLTEVLALHWPASINIRSFLVPGFLSGFTTFSAFALESGVLYGKGSYWTMAIYIFLTVILSLSAFFGGLKLVKMFS